MPDDSFRINWDLLISLLLFFTFFVTPYRIAFTDKDNLGWTIIDSTIDLIFCVDICMNFFMAYYNDEYILIDSRCKIAGKYIGTWFFIDMLAVIPFNLIIPTGKAGSSDYSSLVRLSKFPRLLR